MDLRINIGCGRMPTPGWRNFDNSISLHLSRFPGLPRILRGLRLIDDSQYQFIRFAHENDIGFGDATKGLAIQDACVDVIYSSHMLEHLDRNDVTSFLKEAFRLLRPGGTIRIAIPDIKKMVDHYNETGDADSFIESTHLCVSRPRSVAQRLRLLLVGTRHHQWMYDGRSLSNLLRTHGFMGTEVMPTGTTTICQCHPLDLHERASESIYVEAQKPK
jgi:predicted SAM-dependent methyltransferase